MSAKRPKPVRLTKDRALALLAASEAGVEGWREQIHETVGNPTADLEAMRLAESLDAMCQQAEDAQAVIRNRYVQIPSREPETLF